MSDNGINRNQVSQRGVSEDFPRECVGIGYVSLPKDQERESFISNCVRTNTISIFTNNGERIDNVKVSKNIASLLEFPEKWDQLGSMVIYNTVPKFNQPVVIGILDKNNEGGLFNENTYSAIRETLSGEASMRINGLKNSIVMKVYSKSSEVKPTYTISVGGVNEDGYLKMLVDDLIEIISKRLSLLVQDQIYIKIGEKNIVKYVVGTGFSYIDEFDNEISTGDGFICLGKRDSSEPMLLGTKTTDLLKDFKDEVKKITVSTAFGPSSTPINSPAFDLLFQSIETLLSKRNNLD